jgi:hypothetical protein
MTKQKLPGPLAAPGRPSVLVVPSVIDIGPVLDVAILVHYEEPYGPASLEARAGSRGC